MSSSRARPRELASLSITSRCQPTRAATALFHHLLLCALLCASLARGVAPTDEYRDADLRQNSYLDNHNMDPAVVDSAQFGILWKQTFNNQEQFYAKPLVFTPNATGKQIIFMASSGNWIRTLDAVTGNIITARQVQTPFLRSDISCTDIPNIIGITGTPVIDPETEIAYFYAKSYIANYRIPGPTGVPNGVYYFYAVRLSDLSDVSGFPVLVDGSVAQNDPRKHFIGGAVLQRPSLLKVGNFVYAGFGGHCDLFNYTGTILGIDVTSAEIVTNFAISSGPNSPASTNIFQSGGGGEAGLWQSGMGLSTDGQRIFIATGNGNNGENQGIPASGQSGLRTLQECVINLAIDSTTGVLTVADYFQPYDYVNMDGGDQDFGSGGVALLDPGTFNGNGVNRLAVTTGKNGKIYIMNADNLGGYKQAPGGADLVIQEIVTGAAVFGGVGSYPLEGGYIYSTPVGYPTFVYKLAPTISGSPNFVLVGQTNSSSAGRVGAGIPTITTFQGNSGTAILWTTDPDAGLRAWYAVPRSDGSMKQINLPQLAGSIKFQRPAFGNGRVYTTDNNGVLYCLGSPVNLPLSCQSPVNFGSVTLGTSRTQTISCTANIGIISLNSIVTGDPSWVVNLSTVPAGPIAQGTQFSFSVSWDLIQANISQAVNASFSYITPGVKSTPLTLNTTNAVSGYATVFPLSLTGTEVSNTPFLAMTPKTVDFGGLVTGVSNSPLTATLTFTITNLGETDMTILGYAYQTSADDDSPWTNSTYSTVNSTWDLGPGFTTNYLPPVGGTVGAGQTVSIISTFTVNNGTGEYLSYLNVWSTGGTSLVILEGSSSTAPIADIEVSTGEGGWLPCTVSSCQMSFGSGSPGLTISRFIRICNIGGSPLMITKSKPPLGTIRALYYGIDLHETQSIAAGTCANGTVLFSPPVEVPNLPDNVITASWTLNTDDLTSGVHIVNMTGISHDRQLGPLYSNGSSIYGYLGCYQDRGNAAGTRLFSKQIYSDQVNNTNGKCQFACQNAGYVFAGTQYQQECWCGNALPSSQYYYPETSLKCTYSCTGDASQACGGYGTFMSIYYNSMLYTVNNSTYNTTGTTVATPSGPTSGPTSGPQTVNYSAPYSFVGCYSDIIGHRGLSALSPNAPKAGGSVEYCASQCAKAMYLYMGVEYSNECYCGNIINAPSTLQPGDPVAAGCNMPCTGNASEYCGGAGRMNVYQLNSASTSGSSTTSSGTSTSSSGTTTTPGISTSSGSASLTTSTSLSGTSASSTSTTVILPSSTLSSTSLTGSGTSSTVTPSTTTSSASTSPSLISTTSTTSTTSKILPTAPPMIGNYTYQGCYNDTVGVRALTSNNLFGTIKNNMTLERCSAFCFQYAYFGVEYAQECYCGAMLSNYALNVSASGCSQACPGNTTELCGGPNRLQMYFFNASMH